MIKEGLDIEEEDVKAKFEVKKMLIDMEYIMKAQVVKDNSMTSYMVIKKSMEINSNHFCMSELKKK
eukprot:7302541-Heterocapsa_arctica.AAC.1